MTSKLHDVMSRDVFPCDQPGCQAPPFDSNRARGQHRFHAHGIRAAQSPHVLPAPTGSSVHKIDLPDDLWGWIVERAAVDERTPEVLLKRLLLKVRDTNPTWPLPNPNKPTSNGAKTRALDDED